MVKSFIFLVVYSAMGCIPSQPVSDPVSDSRTEGRSGGRPDSSGGRPDSSGGRPDSSSAKSRRHAATNGGDAAVTARLDEKKAESLNGVPSGRKSRGSSRAAAIDDADTIRPQSVRVILVITVAFGISAVLIAGKTCTSAFYRKRIWWVKRYRSTPTQ